MLWRLEAVLANQEKILDQFFLLNHTPMCECPRKNCTTKYKVSYYFIFLSYIYIYKYKYIYIYIYIYILFSIMQFLHFDFSSQIFLTPGCQFGVYCEVTV